MTCNSQTLSLTDKSGPLYLDQFYAGHCVQTCCWLVSTGCWCEKGSGSLLWMSGCSTHFASMSLTSMDMCPIDNSKVMSKQSGQLGAFTIEIVENSIFPSHMLVLCSGEIFRWINGGLEEITQKQYTTHKKYTLMDIVFSCSIAYHFERKHDGHLKLFWFYIGCV